MTRCESKEARKTDDGVRAILRKPARLYQTVNAC